MSAFKQKYTLPLSVQMQFRGTEYMDRKVRDLAKEHNVEVADVLRIMVMHYAPKADHFKLFKKEKS